MVSSYSYFDAFFYYKAKIEIFHFNYKTENNILIDTYCSSFQTESEIITVEANPIKYNKAKTILLPWTKQRFLRQDPKCANSKNAQVKALPIMML